MSTTSTQLIHTAVQERYAAIAEAAIAEAAGAACCETDAACCDGNYASDLSDLPQTVTGLSLGCGDPVTLAGLAPGQTVLDLGSGGGIDCFLAARQVGPTGRIIGVDMTPAMLARAEANRAKVGADNVEFRQGQIEALPVDDASVDVIISNCVVNLSPDKPAVFREAYRVLRPGGRLAISDIVTQGSFSTAQRADMDSWSACVSGAEDVDSLVRWLRDAGFAAISIRDKGAPDVELAGALSLDLGLRVFSARITAKKQEQ